MYATFFNIIINITIVSVIQIVFANIWYSKLLFNEFISNNYKTINSFKFLLNSIVKSITIYAVTSNIFFILPKLFFYIVILLCILIFIYEIDNYTLNTKPMQPAIIKAMFNVFSLLIGFYASLILLT